MLRTSLPSLKRLRRAVLISLLIGLVSAYALADQAVRVVTWNVETVGAPGSEEYDATAAVLARINANVVAVQEVVSADDVDYLGDLAFDLGYTYSVVAPYGPFGSQRTAFLSDFPITWSEDWSSAELSGDPLANDLTRYILEVELELTGDGDRLRMIVSHLKSGSSNTDEYRRAIESYRMGQAAGDPQAPDAPLVMLGDLNADVGDGPMTPEVFTSIPDDLPGDFDTGADIEAMLADEGLLNDPFAWLAPHGSILEATQLDGSDATRPESGRRIDYVLADDSIRALEPLAQVYDCADEGLAGGLPLWGAPLEPVVCETASDHLPVFADLTIPTSTSDCAAETALAQQPNRASWIDLLRVVRDDVLSTSPVGRQLVDTYYRHSDEVRAQLLTRPGLTWRALKLIRMLQPDLESAARGVTPSFDSRDIASIRAFAQQLGENASPALRADLGKFIEHQLFALITEIDAH
ncbi:endonuclease/exonuclease/phosphatase family protein [Thiohalocapsa marina]|nr:endonuclease/exonuclease/phosphatase family protein [Thiohalocapsa marina]